MVARALGSTQCEAEARGLMIEQGLSLENVEQILTHLSAPVLSQLEQTLVPLARETVWYQPAQIQRRCAEAQSDMSNEQFLDFCGAVSLFNSLCRLGLIIDMRA